MKKLIVLAVAILLISPAAFSQMKAGKQDNTKHTVLHSCLAQAATTSYKTGTCPFCGMKLNLSQKEQVKLQATAAYSCPMHGDVTNNNNERRTNLSLKEEMKMKVVNISNNHLNTSEAGIQSAKCPHCGKDVAASQTK